MIKAKLLDRIREIMDRKVGGYPYELYTLMCVEADKYGINYTMDLHQELLDENRNNTNRT